MTLQHKNRFITKNIVASLLMWSLVSVPTIIHHRQTEAATGSGAVQARVGTQARTAIASPESAIELLSSYQESGSFGRYSNDVRVVGNLAYLVDPYIVTIPGQTEGLRIFDLGNPLSPTLTLRGEAHLPFGALSVDVRGKYAYVYSLGNGVKTVDVSNPASPVIVASYPLVSDTSDALRIIHDNIYIPYQNQVKILDISSPLSLTLLHTIDLSPYIVFKNRVSGNRAYLLSVDNKLYIVDITNPDNPTLLTTYQPAGSTFVDAWGEGNLAYLVVDQELQILDLSDPGAPRLLARHNLRNGERTRVDVFDKTAYVVSLQCLVRIRPGCTTWQTTLEAFDVSDPTNLFLRGRYTSESSEWPISLKSAGGFIFDSGKQLRLRRLIPPTSASAFSDGSLESSVDSTSYRFPTGSFTQPVTLTHVQRFSEDLPSTGALFSIGHAFQTSARLATGNQVLSTTLPYTLSVQYTAGEQSVAIESTLALYYWNGAQWVKEPTSTLNTQTHTLQAQPQRLGLWAVLGETRRTLLPLLLQGQS